MIEINLNFVIGITIIVINAIPLLLRKYKYIAITAAISVLLYLLTVLVG